ncbi:CLUMA_CG019393, isoform A [Clunio marinus]|uniref:CLUMA_CG019393, isoform A n=1 Tax=Clunio marinus TaxID=568069 RepID=A0A1J1J0T7_9DIPT|nr:CLUMA_CG019393, isoform A [Clunio marinus]
MESEEDLQSKVGHTLNSVLGLLYTVEDFMNFLIATTVIIKSNHMKKRKQLEGCKSSTRVL